MRRTGLLSVLAVSLAARALAADAPQPILTPEQIAERALPSVVLIKTNGGLGTGFVVRQDGRIATNLHVIDGTERVTVILADKRELPILDVVTVDARHDLAIIHVAATGLPALTLGDSDLAKPGEAVVAIGHPMGLGNTVSNGLVSAIREIGDEMKLLQVSAPISTGSSGGPLIDEHGAVIGISVMLSTEGQNLNFGVPVNYLKPLVNDDGSHPLSYLSARHGGGKKVVREIPNHPLSLLEGCSDNDLRKIRDAIGNAIQVGAPLYNDGNTAACFRIYQDAALDLKRSMKSCEGPRNALLDGVHKASLADDDSKKAWRMRDAFDGVIDVIERKLGVSEGASGRELSARRVTPKFGQSVLEGCSDEDLKRVGKAIAGAIELGAPLYNQGNVSACFRIYEGASLDLMRKLGKCKGVRRELRRAIDNAGKSDDYNEKAWMMRDLFDGLVDAMTRKEADR